LVADTSSLLPLDNRTPFEDALSTAIADAWSIPTELLDTIWTAADCPPNVLPALASGLSVQLWRDSWPLAKKRSVTGRSVALSRIRGTEPAFAEYLEQVDAKLLKLITPPQTLTPRAARTQAEREAFKAKFPEVRVYPFRNRHVRKGLIVCGRPIGGRRRIARETVAPEFAGRRAEYRDGDIVRPIAVRVEPGTAEFVAGLFELRLPVAGKRLMTGRPWTGANAIARSSTAKARVYRYTEGEGRPDLLWPSAEPLDIRPDRVREAHHLPARLIAGRPWGGRRRFLALSLAGEHVYDSVHLFDAARVSSNGASSRRGGWILGRSRLGMEAFRIEAVVDSSFERPGRRFSRRLPGIVRNHDDERMSDITAAVRAAKLGRDKIMVRTGIYRPIEARDAIPADGSFRLGQIVRSI
jgi:phage tail P2-like protein